MIVHEGIKVELADIEIRPALRERYPRKNIGIRPRWIASRYSVAASRMVLYAEEEGMCTWENHESRLERNLSRRSRPAFLSCSRFPKSRGSSGIGSPGRGGIF